MRIGIMIWLALLVFCAGYLWLSSDALPAEVPVQFGSHGSPVQWMGRDAFLAWTMASLIGLNALFAGVLLVLRKAEVPPYISLPWRAYWTATPRRRAQVVTRLRDINLMGGIVANACWLLAYNLIMQAIGTALLVAIPEGVAIYLILVGVVALVYSLIAYLHPP